MLVTVTALKGGASKTTTAVCLAHAAMAAGRDVLVVDADPQRTAAAWAPELTSVTEPTVTADELRNLGAGQDLVLIDTPPGGAPAAAAAIEAADLVIVPTALGPGDVPALVQQCAWSAVDLIVPTRIDARMWLHGQALSALRETFGEKVTVPVPMAAAVAWAQIYQRPLPPLHRVSIAYRDVYDALVRVEKERA